MAETVRSTSALRSRQVVTPIGVRDCAIVIRDGTIVTVEEWQNIPVSIPMEDFGELVISPGLVDPHVHINEPGRTEWEGFETATRAAASGGVTTLVDMPLNSLPVTTTVEALHKKLNAASGKLSVDCGFHAGLVPDNALELKPLLNSGVLGVKAFMIHSGVDDFPNATEADLRAAMPAIAESGLPLLVHAELQTSIPEPKTLNPQGYSHYLASRPRKWENDAVALVIRLCKEFNCRVHIVHLSSSDSVRQLSEAKAAGLPITVETCPHYLFFAAEDIQDGDTRFKCSPPIRERKNNELLWQALRESAIDFIASDHSPCPPEMKLLRDGDFTKAWGGIASLQFGLSIVWTEARKRGFQVSDVSRWMSTNPAKLVGLQKKKGAIASGYDADIVVWNPDESYVVEPSSIWHRHKVTPYEGQTLCGKVHATFVRGKKVFDEGTFSTQTGEVLLRN